MHTRENSENSLNDPPELETERLHLRALSMSDVEDIFEYASNLEVTKYTLWNTHHSRADTRRFIQWLTVNFACWAIVHKADQKVIGTIFLHSFNFQDRQSEIAFNLSQKYWNRGYATEAARAVIPFAFQYWALDRIEGTCMIPNVASARVLAKIGMTYERRIRKYDYDMTLYAIVREQV